MSDALIDAAKVDISARLDKLKVDIKAIPAPAPTPTPTAEYPLTINQNTHDGKWRCKYIGSGKVSATDSPLGFHLVPKTATGTTDSSGVGYETYACEVLSNTKYAYFVLDVDMKTNKQLRTGPNSIGGTGPAPWETGWIFFRFTDEDPKSNHHYYFIIRTDHCEFGKKDNAPGNTTVEQQIYLPRLTDAVKLKPGEFQHVNITANQFHIVITVDGVKVVDYTDTKVNDPTKMGQGLIGFYCEDSDVTFANIKV